MSDALKLQTAPSPTQTPPINLDAVLNRCGGDQKFAAAVTRKFVTQAPPEVAKIEQFLLAGDVDSMRRSAHSLKSMAAFMACDSVTNLAKQIEDLGHANRLSDVTPLLPELKSNVRRATDWLAINNNVPVALSA